MTMVDSHVTTGVCHLQLGAMSASSDPTKRQRRATKACNAYDICRHLATHVLRRN